jgi:DNA modification methylase
LKLILGDCLEEMKKFDDKSFDIVFTSPPFKEKDVITDYWPTYDSWYKEMYRVTDKVLIIIHSATKINKLITDYPPKRMMIWGKGFSRMAWRFNPILVYQISDEYKVNKYIWSDTIGVPSLCGSNKAHVYQDPLVLYDTVLKMFKGCTSVLDPFMGSGTTGAACANLGLDFTGIEKDESYFTVAIHRLDDYL